MKKVKTREKYLQSIEEPNYKLGILFLFPILENRETPPLLPRQFSVEGETSNALTREFNQLDERTHSSTTKRESALGSPLKSPTTNDQIQARDTSEESSELRQQLRFVVPSNCLIPTISKIEINLRRVEKPTLHKLRNAAENTAAK